MSNERAATFHAKCLCKKVQLEIIGLDPNFTACHCNTCQYLHSGPGFGASCNDIKISKGKEFIKEFHSKTDKAHMKRFLEEHGVEKVSESDIPDYMAVWHFCSECGTKLYYRLEDAIWNNKNDQYIASVGFLYEAGQKDLTMKTEAFFDEKPHHYSFKEKTKRLSTDETYEKYIRMSQILPN